MASYQVTAPVVVVKDDQGKERHIYRDSLIPEDSIDDLTAERLLRDALIAEVDAAGAVIETDLDDLGAVTEFDLLRRRSTGSAPVQSELESLLAGLRREGVTLPPQATRALELTHEVRALHQSPRVHAWIAQADLATVDAAQIYDQCRQTLTDTGLTTGAIGPSIVAQCTDALVARAAAAVVADLDRIITELRPTWDQAAALVHKAYQAGIRPTTTAADAIVMGDEAVAAWRTLAQPTAVLNRIWRLRNRLLFIADREIPERDLGTITWLDRASAGPPELTVVDVSWQQARVSRSLGTPIAVHTPDVRQGTDTEHDIEAELTKEQVIA
jgi:hypothetical protein